MKAEELRIGNWVNTPREDQNPFRITGFEYLDETFNGKVESRIKKGTHPLTWYLTDIKPIPITPEWLERAGFEKYDTQFTGIGYKIQAGAFLIEFEYGKEAFLESIGIDILYIHQIQNLYFELSGKNLII